MDELTNIVGEQANCAPWRVGEQQVAAEVSSCGRHSAVPEQAIVATLGDHSKPLWIAQKAGFDIGKSIYERLDRAITIERCYGIVSIGDEKTVKLVATCAFDGKHKTAEISLACSLPQWQASLLAVPVCLQIAMPKPPPLALGIRSV